jgi:hypothetical protein
MSERTSIVNISGDHEETILQLAKHLGTNKMRRKLFDAIYGRGTKARSKKQIMEDAGISAHGTNAQQVQNELDHLSKHHLIVREENTGSVKDGSRYVYRKDPAVRANRQRIVRFADNRGAAERVATKRRPVVSGLSALSSITKAALKGRKHLIVLYLVADPVKATPLRIDAEVQRVQEAIRGSVFRDNITVEYRPAAGLDTLIDGLNDHRPQIVHFSGHGDGRSIATDNGKVLNSAAHKLSFDLLAKALAATDNPPDVIVINSCRSSGARKALCPPGKIVISMRAPVTDIAAIAFARRFYAAIASGQSVKAAFEQGKVAVEAISFQEADTPELFHMRNINPAKVILT